MSTLKVNKIIPTAGVGTDTTTLKNGGGIIQIKQTIKTDTFSTSSTSLAFTGITGLSVDITPTSTSNKIFVICSVNGHNGVESGGTFLIKRDSTDILLPASGTGVEGSITCLGASSDALPTTNTIQGFDSPSSTSALTYSVTVFNTASATRTVSVNSTDGTESARGCSTITVMEIVG